MTSTATPRRAAAQAKIAAMDALPSAFDFDTSTGEIWLDGDIGERPGEISSRGIRDAIKKIGSKRLTVYLNSGGGSVLEGWGVYRQLVQHRAGVTTIVSPLAASMAAVILQAGQERLVDPNAIVMVHNPWTQTSGNATELQQSIDLLRKIETQMLELFSNRTGLDKPEVSRMLTAETWLDAGEAIQLGFADGLTSSSHTAAAAATKIKVRSAHESPATVAARWPRRSEAKSRSAWVKSKLIQHGVL